MADITDLGNMKDIVSAALAGTEINIGGNPSVALPDGFRVHDLSHKLATPIRAANQRRMHTTESFLDYMKFYNQGRNSAVYIDIDQRAMVFITNHSSVDDDGTPMPDWEDDYVQYQMAKTREWKAWLAQSGSSMTQRGFADFIEDRREDIKNPDSSILLEMVDAFRVVQNMEFKSSQRRATGEHSIAFSKENAKGSVEVPEEIILAISPFVRGPAYAVKVRLKYRVNDGELRFTISVVDSALIEDDALEAEVDKVIDLQLGVPHYYGTP